MKIFNAEEFAALCGHVRANALSDDSDETLLKLLCMKIQTELGFEDTDVSFTAVWKTKSDGYLYHIDTLVRPRMNPPFDIKETIVRALLQKDCD